MTYFLERIANHLITSYESSLEKQLVVFPNRRAGLYFLKYLSGYIKKPVWAPSVKTINELFSDLSPYRIGESERLIFELYNVYKNINKKAESFDDFYFWGEMLLNDFDDTDKYLANASDLFSTVRDIKKIDSDFGNLTPEQISAVKRFWVNFEPEKSTREKAEFLEIWKILPRLYTEFRDSLISKNIVYEGIIYKDIADKCKEENLSGLDWENIHFVGFNALNACEKILMKYLKKKGITRFYWDYDFSYTSSDKSHSAGFFIKTNLSEFGNDMPSDWNYETFVSKQPPHITRRIIETSSDVSQVKLLPEILAGIPEINGPQSHHTAVVLSDENLLIPLLSSIPDFISDLNITMGYPLKFSPVYSLIQNIITLQRNAFYKDNKLYFDLRDVINLLNHNYIKRKLELSSSEIIAGIIKNKRSKIPAEELTVLTNISLIFTKTDNPLSFNSYLTDILKYLFFSDDLSGSENSEKFNKLIHNEFIYKTLIVINKLDDIIQSFDTQIHNNTYFRLIDKVLRSISVPFSGEPLNGMQVMGILETRTLDFKNLIILSVNEGIIPKSSAAASFIPYNLREAFGLPTIKHQDSIYAYYFYRLLERSENVTFIYNSDSEGIRSGEKSRLLLQLNYLNENPPEKKSVGYDFIPQVKLNQTVKKTLKINEKLKKSFIANGSSGLSPSALNTWLNCSMKFYYRYVCDLKEQEKLSTEVDPALFGELFHSVMNEIYKPYCKQLLTGEIIDKVRNEKENTDGIICEFINNSISLNEGQLSGNEIIIKNILTSYINLVLKYDRKLNDLYLDSLEKEISGTFRVKSNNEFFEVRTRGIIDRIDSMKGIKRIVDYKTGNVNSIIPSVGSLFERESEKRNDAWFQLLMYCEIFYRNMPGPVRPSLYCLRKISDKDYSDSLIIKELRDSPFEISDYSLIRDEFSERLENVLALIFDDNVNFNMTNNEHLCEYCLYKKLCLK